MTEVLKEAWWIAAKAKAWQNVYKNLSGAFGELEHPEEIVSMCRSFFMAGMDEGVFALKEEADRLLKERPAQAPPSVPYFGE